jgi:hypothetical protein
VRQFEIVGLVETWVEERSWKKYKSCYQKNTNGNVKEQNEERRKEKLRGIITEARKGRRRRMYGKKRTYRQ